MTEIDIRNLIKEELEKMKKELWEEINARASSDGIDYFNKVIYLNKQDD